MSECDVLRLLCTQLLLHWHPEEHLLKQAHALLLAEIYLAIDCEAADVAPWRKRSANACGEG